MAGEETLRDEFAAAALTGLIAQYRGDFPVVGLDKELLDVAEHLAKAAFAIADAMEAEANRFER